MERKTTKLRALLARDELLMCPGAYDALTAKAAVKAGFDVVYMTGDGVTGGLTGLPDIGLTTMTEMIMMATNMAAAVPVPLISDADTGYGNAINVMRTIEAFERAGVSGVHMEDQVHPKRCGHISGKRVIPAEEMVGKIRAAVAARSDPDFLIIARTDSRAVTSFEDAVKRGIAYREAGADVIFPEAMLTPEEFARFAREVGGLLLANMTEFGKSPYLSATELRQMGYKMAIYPCASQRVAIKAVLGYYDFLKANGGALAYADRMQTRDEYYEMIGFPEYIEREKQFVKQS
ncbi:MAG TPA: isocitrate lyase/phosphoenolpyruvate mutase family protein [Usitatibacter sp.]|nr:isocitrate lyase/phosphoenolpyruvate mutase family protein [Usitatibacter sp.]